MQEVAFEAGDDIKTNKSIHEIKTHTQIFLKIFTFWNNDLGIEPDNCYLNSFLHVIPFNSCSKQGFDHEELNMKIIHWHYSLLKLPNVN